MVILFVMVRVVLDDNVVSNANKHYSIAWDGIRGSNNGDDDLCAKQNRRTFNFVPHRDVHFHNGYCYFVRRVIGDVAIKSKNIVEYVNSVWPLDNPIVMSNKGYLPLQPWSERVTLYFEHNVSQFIVVLTVARGELR